MGAIAVIFAQVFKRDFYQSWKYNCSNPLPSEPVSTDYEVQGAEYFVPQQHKGVIRNYAPSTEQLGVGDEIATVRLRHKVSGETIWLLGTASDWADRVNACCGETPAMPVITTPDPISEDTPCGIIDCTATDPVYPYAAQHTDAIITGQKLQLTGAVDNGSGPIAFSPAPSASGFASVAAALAWAQSNWSAYGTFTAVGTTGIAFNSTSVKKGKFDLQLIDQDYCVTITAGQVYNQVKINNVLIALDSPVTVVDAATLQPILDAKIDGTLVVNSSTKLQYTGKNVPQGLYYNGVSVVNFVTGVC